MPTQFDKIIYRENTGEIRTITDLPVWLCKPKQWATVPPVIIRNALLFALHPSDRKFKKVCTI